MSFRLKNKNTKVRKKQKRKANKQYQKHFSKLVFEKNLPETISVITSISFNKK